MTERYELLDNAELLDECRALIAFYEARGLNWADAVAFTVLKHTGRIDATHPCCIHRRKRA